MNEIVNKNCGCDFEDNDLLSTFAIQLRITIIRNNGSNR